MVISILCGRVGRGKRDILLSVREAMNGYMYDCVTNRFVGNPTASVQCYSDVDAYFAGPSFLWDKIDTQGYDMRYAVSCSSLEMASKIWTRYPFANIISKNPMTFSESGKSDILYWSDISLATYRSLYATYSNVVRAKDRRSKYLCYNTLFGNYACFVRDLVLKLDAQSKDLSPHLINEYVNAVDVFDVLNPVIKNAYYDLISDNQLGVENLIVEGKQCLIPTVEFIRVSLQAINVRQEMRTPFELLSYLCTFHKGNVTKEQDGFHFESNVFSFDDAGSIFLNGEKTVGANVMRFIDKSAI